MTYENTAKAALTVLAALVSSGCDGATESEGLGDAGSSSSCTSLPGGSVTVVSVDMSRNKLPTVVEQARQLCVGWSAVDAYGSGSQSSCTTYLLSAGMAKTTAEAECKASPMTEVECEDASHDYPDSAGIKHTYAVTSPSGNIFVLKSFGVLIGCGDLRSSPICTAQGPSGVYLGQTCE